MQEHTQETLQEMTVSDLRTLARQMTSIPGLRIAGMRKDALISAILQKPLPFVEGKNGNGGSGSNDLDLAAILAEALKGKIESEAVIDEEKVKAISQGLFKSGFDEMVNIFDKKIQSISEEVANHCKDMIKEVVVTVPDVEKKNIGVQHYLFENILKLAAIRQNIFLVGPAGSGKTTLCSMVAKALDLPFYFIPVGLQTTKGDLIGFKDANGQYRGTHLRTAYENGGVFLLDELDAGHAGVLTIINGMLANGIASFPDKMVERHKDFIFIAAGNTYGRGADRQYVGRNQLDGATLDRFAVVDFDYDAKLETALSSNKYWTKKVQGIRKHVMDLKEKVIVSPRASIEGSKALAAGFTEDEIMEMYIFRGVNAEVKARIMERIKKS